MSAETERGLLYVDASALVKLILPEAESAALVEELSTGTRLISSILCAVETRRALLLAGSDEDLATRAEEILDTVTLVGMTEAISRAAGTLRPPRLRTLDAVHLATALSFGKELEALVAYDRRLCEAARFAALEVRAPGSETIG